MRKKCSISFFIYFFSLLVAHAQASSILPFIQGNPHKLSQYISNPSNLSLTNSYKQEVIYGIHSYVQGSLTGYTNPNELRTQLSTLVRPQTVDTNAINDIETILNNYVNNNDYQLKGSAYGNVQLLLPNKSNNIQIGLQTHITGYQELLSNNGFKVDTTEITNLINNAIASSSINSSDFVDGIDSDAGFSNALIQIQTLYYGYDTNWMIKRQMRLATSIKVKFSRFSLSENLYSLKTTLKDYLTNSDSFNLKNFRKTLGNFNETEEHISANINIGAAIYTPKFYWGIVVIDPFSQAFKFSKPTETCDDIEQCHFATEHYANRQRTLTIDSKMRGEFSYLFPRKMYFYTHIDFKSWLDYDNQLNQYAYFSFGSHSALFNQSKILGFSNPSMTLSYIANLQRDESYLNLGLGVWQLYINLSISPSFLSDANIPIDSLDEKSYHLAVSLSFSNSY